MNSNDYVHFCIIGCQGNSLLHFGFNKKSAVRDFSGEGGGSILQHLYLNVYTEFNSKISYIIMFYMIMIWPVKYLR